MQKNIAKIKIYCVDWDDGLFFLHLNLNDEGLIINQYRPPDIEEIIRNDTFISQKNEEEFLYIWTKYIIGLSVCSKEKDIVERNIGALTFLVMESTFNSHNITFYDLLSFMDCFSMMLNEQGFSEEKIKNMYVPVTKAILLNFKNKIVDKETGEIFIGTSKYQKLLNLTENNY